MQKQYIAHVDSKDNFIGPIEKWEAHEKGILHRAFTVILKYEDQIILQHRRHPVFDDVFDTTISSHQLILDDKIQSVEISIALCLKREWNVDTSDLKSNPILKGKIYYRAKDSNNKYIEHEYCRVYECNLKRLTLPNLEFAYGTSLKTIEELKNENSYTYKMLAPWVVEIIKNGLV